MRPSLIRTYVVAGNYRLHSPVPAAHFLLPLPDTSSIRAGWRSKKEEHILTVSNLTDRSMSSNLQWTAAYYNTHSYHNRDGAKMYHPLHFVYM